MPLMDKQMRFFIFGITILLPLRGYCLPAEGGGLPRITMGYHNVVAMRLLTLKKPQRNLRLTQRKQSYKKSQ
jgi:hypothetical protein